ncbi:MAG: hypothetical protein PHF67_02610 [Candidatus Nanoarchaeia archaeon]|nr:hypothetical protein [Candidatus Nanoarchaeia archaeon]
MANDEYKKLAVRNYEEAYKTIDAALSQVKAYLALMPTNLTRDEANALAGVGKRIGKLSEALEQRIEVLSGMDVFKR